MKKNRLWEIHADDFGSTVGASRDIIACCKKGALDGISVIPNMACFENCAAMYRAAAEEFPFRPAVSVHLNLMDGKCMAGREKVPDLTDERGYFKLSWGRLFLLNFCPGPKKETVKKQLAEELRMQAEAVRIAFPEQERFRIDSHQHTHMIPFVFDSLLQAIDTQGWDTSYVRIAKEPILPFLKAPELYPTYRPVNLIKNILLNLCSVSAAAKLDRRGIPYKLFWGLIMSGSMDAGRIARLAAPMESRARRCKKGMEILFHPGAAEREEMTEEYGKKGFVDFYCSADRKAERETVLRVRKILAEKGARK